MSDPNETTALGPSPPPGDPQERLQQILLAYVEAAESGAAPDQKAFLAAHPEFADDIAEFLGSYEHVKRLATPMRPRSEPRSDDLRAPEFGRLGDYTIQREIGRGGMGVVYEAEQISLRRRVALKILPFIGGADPRQLQRFRNEAEAAAHLHHSHIVPVFAVGCERGVHYYAMQFIDGQSLAGLIAGMSAEGQGTKDTREDAKTASRSLSTEHTGRTRRFFHTVANIGKQTAEALEYAHQNGIIHRDIKPANLLLDGRGDVWITDFGLAQFQAQAGLTMSGEMVGTLRYVSPEQALARRGLIDHHTDIYSLGATLYELLTLKPVFDGRDRHAILNQIGNSDPLPLRMIDPTIPVELETIVLKALAKTPGERYASAQEMADDLQRFLDDKPILAQPPTVVDRARKWMRRHPGVVAATALLLVVCVIASTVSALAIAAEQQRTKTAYYQLVSTQAQTEDAYKKLAIEEKRTKAAYDALAIEQERTRQALEAEAALRDRAERDYEQARRALELIVQFSEGELAHHPIHQDVRRRLLETVLEYYEEFRMRHDGDRAELDAGRERAAVILTELAGLRGPTLLVIAQNPAVQKDLDLSAEQRAQLEQSAQGFERESKQFGKFGPGKGPNRSPGAYLSSAAVEKAIAEVLTEPQKKRFQQVVLQVQQQGRNGFSDPKLTESLGLTATQRASIRRIQADAHRAWSEHVFSDKKIASPADFWDGVWTKIVAVMNDGQQDRWRQLAGPPITIALREGYPFDGQNVNLPSPGPAFAFPNYRKGEVIVAESKDGEFIGSGFGHKRYVDDRQYFTWKGKEIPPTAFEIAVTAKTLTPEERTSLIAKDPPGPAPDDGPGWLVLLRSQDPTVWNTDSPDETRFAIPLSRADERIRYLRLKRMDTGESLIVPITLGTLRQPVRRSSEHEATWNGTAHEAFNARHLGIAAGPAVNHPMPDAKDRKPPFKGK